MVVFRPSKNKNILTQNIKMLNL